MATKINQLQYVYQSLFYSPSGLIGLHKDGKLYNQSGTRLGDLDNIICFNMFYSSIFLDSYGNVYTSTSKSSKVVGLPSNVVWVECTYDGYVAVTSDGKAYGWGSNSYGELGIGSKNSVSTPILLNPYMKLPDDEKPFYFFGHECQFSMITTKGNLYTAGGHNHTNYNWVKTNFPTKAICCSGEGSNSNYQYVIDEYGDLYYWNNTNNTFSKISGISKCAWMNNARVPSYAAVSTHDGYFYTVSGTTVTKSNISNVFPYNGFGDPDSAQTCLIDNNGNVYKGNGTSFTLQTGAGLQDLKEVTFKATIYAYIADKEITFTNQGNETFYIKLTYNQDIAEDNQSNVVNYVTQAKKWVA